MSALAHPVPIGPLPVRRRHLTLVPAPVAEEPERLAAVIPMPIARPAVPQRESADRAPLRLTVRGRRVLAALVILLCAVLGSIGGAALASAQQLPTDVTSVTVSSGDTLWSIAAEVATPGSDVRDVMAQIAALNGLHGSDLQAGQQLDVPAAG